MLKHCAEKSGKPVRNCATIFYQKDTILSTKMQAKNVSILVKNDYKTQEKWVKRFQK